MRPQRLKDVLPEFMLETLKDIKYHERQPIPERNLVGINFKEKIFSLTEQEQDDILQSSLSSMYNPLYKLGEFCRYTDKKYGRVIRLLHKACTNLKTKELIHELLSDNLEDRSSFRVLSLFQPIFMRPIFKTSFETDDTTIEWHPVGLIEARLDKRQLVNVNTFMKLVLLKLGVKINDIDHENPFASPDFHAAIQKMMPLVHSKNPIKMLVTGNPVDMMRVSVSPNFSSCLNMYTGEHKTRLLGNIFDPNCMAVLFIRDDSYVDKHKNVHPYTIIARAIIRKINATENVIDNIYPRTNESMDKFVEIICRRIPVKRFEIGKYAYDVPLEHMAAVGNYPYLDRGQIQADALRNCRQFAAMSPKKQMAVLKATSSTNLIHQLIYRKFPFSEEQQLYLLTKCGIAPKEFIYFRVQKLLLQRHIDLAEWWHGEFKIPTNMYRQIKALEIKLLQGVLDKILEEEKNPKSFFSPSYRSVMHTRIARLLPMIIRLKKHLQQYPRYTDDLERKLAREYASNFAKT